MEYQVNNFTGYQGGKSKLARMAIGLSCEGLTEETDKTKQLVSRLEKGRRPSEQCPELISSVLMIKSGFLFTERKYALEGDVYHSRNKKSRTQTLINSVLARAEIPNIIISAAEGEAESPDVNIPEHLGAELLTPNDTGRMVEDYYRAWNLGLGSVSSMTKLAESSGITVAYVTGTDDRVDALIVHNSRPIIIRDNIKKDICRFRFDLGHELGYLVMHKGVMTGDKFTESQADRFSSTLLVPRLSFIKEFPRIRGKQFDWNALVEFKPRRKISLRMCTYRASALDLLTQERVRTGYMHLNSRGYTKVEPGDELLRPEGPGMPAETIKMLDDAT